MKEAFTFDDVLIEPDFSYEESRKYISLASNIGKIQLELPIISTGMDTITSDKMAFAMFKNGGLGCLHRFWGIEENLIAYKNSPASTIVSFGASEEELERVRVLYCNGAKNFCLDDSHGANIKIVRQSRIFAEKYVGDPDVTLIVGAFATPKQIVAFRKEFDPKDKWMDRLAFRVGIGPGSACTTRVKTGCGYPQLSAIIECSKLGFPIIADGGCRIPGDIAKALAAGASAVMLGGMLAGTYETPGEIVENEKTGLFKKYRGSASKESYDVQGKTTDWRAAEGEAFWVECKGAVDDVLQDIAGGLRGAFTTVGASNLEEFQSKARFVRVSSATVLENTAHGKRF